MDPQILIDLSWAYEGHVMRSTRGVNEVTNLKFTMEVYYDNVLIKIEN